MITETEFFKTLGKKIVECIPVKETDPIEFQFNHYALKLGLLTSEINDNIPEAYIQDKLIPVYKEFTEKVEKILKGE